MIILGTSKEKKTARSIIFFVVGYFYYPPSELKYISINSVLYTESDKSLEQHALVQQNAKNSQLEKEMMITQDILLFRFSFIHSFQAIEMRSIYFFFVKNFLCFQISYIIIPHTEYAKTKQNSKELN
jgi:hypothetical protein